MIAEKLKKLPFLQVLVLLFLTVPVFAQDDADIYSLWPFTDKDNVSLQAASSLHKPARFWREKIIVNGTELQLDISLVEDRLKDIRLQLGKLFRGRQDVFMGGNANSILLQEIQKDGSLKRQYYLELSGIQPVLLFEMVLPPGQRKHAAEEDWPAELPFVHGATELTSMRFPARDAVYGACCFREKLMPQVLGEMTDALGAMGWEKVSREADNVFEGTGEVFLKDNAGKLLILGIVNEPGGRGVRVSMYTRAIHEGEEK